MIEGHIANPPSRKILLAVLGAGVAVASLIVAGAILPAEFHIDPLGIGDKTGLLKLSRPEEVKVALPAAGSNTVARFYPTVFRSDAVDIPLAASGDPQRRDELEWKVRMKSGDTLVYSWSVDAPAEEFYF